MSSSSDVRPGQDPSCPHQDLRIPNQFPSYYLNQSLPSTSLHLQTLSTPPVAVQIASLHRAAEVARFEWRASQRQILADRQTALSSNSNSRQYQPLPQHNEAGSSTRNNRQANSNQSDVERNRVYSSSLDAYISAARDLSRAADDAINATNDAEVLEEYFTDDFSEDSDSTESEVLASTLRPLQERRRQSNDQERLTIGSQSETLPNQNSNTSQATLISTFTEEYSAESQVWDRMVEDLAIGAGIGGRSRNTSGSLGNSPYSRGISAGIAASMLALSASIPRPEMQNAQRGGSSSNPSRLLPHPIWARRYPGAAGEWLRGELARRASAPLTTRQQNSILPSTSSSNNSATTRRTIFGSDERFRSTDAFDDIFSNPRTRDRTTTRLPSSTTATSTTNAATTTTPSSPWSVLRFPSLDPTLRSGIRSTLPTSSEGPPVALVQSDSSSNTLAVPSNAAALAPTPPPGLSSETQPLLQANQSNSRPSQNANESETSQSSTRNEAAELVARMAQMLRDRNARNGSENRSPNRNVNERSSRAVRGGMEYIRSLRVLDGMNTNDNSANIASQRSRLINPPSPPRPSEIFPWYPTSATDDLTERMSSLRIASNTDEEGHDPNGASSDWYQMVRARMTSQSAALSAGPDPSIDPNGETIEDGAEQSLRVRRRILTSGGTSDAIQRQRNRSARVMVESRRQNRSTDENEESNNSVSRQQHNTNSDFWNVVDGWTVINPRPSSPIRRTRDEGSENVTTWTHAPALSASPGLIDHAQEVERTVESTNDDLRSTRPIRRLPSLTPEDVSFALDNQTSTLPDGRRTSVEVEVEGQTNTRSGSLPSMPIRRAEFSSGMVEERQFRTTYREDTPSPEPRRDAIEEGSRGQISSRIHQLSSIGARLEEEFRIRQGELREREQRLRSEVARRRMELDQLRQRQGRIGRVVERSRRDHDDGEEQSITPQEGEQTSPTRVNGNTSNPQVTPLTSTSLVRRRTVRDSAPSLRSFRRTDNRISMAMPILNDTLNRQMTLNTITAIHSLQSIERQSIHNGRLRRSRSFTSLSQTPRIIMHDQISLDDNMAFLTRAHDFLQSISPSISIDNADAIGTSGLALITFVDALAAPFSIIRATRFGGLPLQLPSIVQPTLPSTLNDTMYPLRFDFVGGQQSKTDQNNVGVNGEPSSGSVAYNVSNIFLNDESTCPVEPPGLNINLKFLAATPGSSQQFRISDHSIDGSTRRSQTGEGGQQRQSKDSQDSFFRSLNAQGIFSQMLSGEEQDLVNQCLKEAKKKGSVDLMTPQELFLKAGESARSLLEKRKDSLCRLPWFGPLNSNSVQRRSSILNAANSVPSFCLSRLTMKVPHRTALSARRLENQGWPVSFGNTAERPRWMVLIFVSWTPISTTDLKEYDGYSEEDVVRLAERYGRKGPGLEPIDQEFKMENPRNNPIPFDEDEELGDPYAMSNAGGKEKLKEEQNGSTEQGSKPALLPVGLGFLELSQANFEFGNRDSYTDFDSDTKAKYLESVQGVSGKYLAIKVMLTTRRRTKTLIDYTQANLPELEIQWIGAQGYAGPRSFGEAGWKD